MEFLHEHQLNIMLFLSGVCGILPLFTLISTTIHKKRKIAIIALEVCETLMLLADRYAYIFRGDTSALGFYMVRVSNFLVFFLNIALLYAFNLFLCDLFTTDAKMADPPLTLQCVGPLVSLSIGLLVFSQFTGLYYTFDEFNRYKREAGFFICYSIPFIIALMQLAVIIQHFSKLGKKTRSLLLFFTLLPIAASIAQVFAYGVSLLDISYVSNVVLIYVFSLVDANKKVDRANKLERDFLMQEQEEMQIVFGQTAEALASAIDAKDKYTHGHSMRVAEYSKEIAALAGKTPKECREIYFAGLLHDVGKIGIPDTIINKEGKLSDEEFAAIKRHPVIGKQILSRITKSPYLSIGANFHHERYDGRGYPQGLKGDDIPDAARIIAVADAYDAMTSRRSYREPIPQQKAREEIVKGMDSQFDPVYARAMLHLIDLDTEYQMQEREEISELAGKNELLCGDYKSAFSEGMPLSDCRMKLRLRSKSDPQKAGPKSLPSLILFDALDGRIHKTQSKQKETLYFKYAEICFDGSAEAFGARKIQVEKTDAIQEQVDWTEELKKGVYYELECVKFEDHVLITIENRFQKLKITVALPDKARFAYISLTGQDCHITNVEVKKDETPVGKDYIKRIAEEISYIDGYPQGDIPNLQVDGWRASCTQGIPVTDGMEISFHAKSLPTARLIWHCPFASLFYSDNALAGGKNYQEFTLIRFDGENWESNDKAETRLQVSKNENFKGWDAWKEANKSGLDCVARFKRNGNTVIAKTENCGIEITAVTEIKAAVPEIYVSLTGDQCALTNIHIKR